MAFLTEADIERALLSELASLGYQTTTEAEIGPDGPAAERDAFSDVLLLPRLQAAIDRLNPDLPPEARADALRQVVATVSPSLIEENRRLHGLITEGVPVEYRTEDGAPRGDRVRLIDFEHLENNDWLAVGQFTVIEAGHNRRADVVLFVNGLPLELKSPSSEQATIAHAYHQLQTYKHDIPSLFRTNAALVISDGQMARIGSLTANAERFMRWRTIDGATIAPDGTPEQPALVQGALARDRLLALLRDFTVFGRKDDGLVKILAGYHQFHAVLRAVASTLRALALSESDARPNLGEDPADYGLPGVKDYQRGDRRICVAMYEAIVVLRPDWHSDQEDRGAIKIVMTGSASDPEHWQRYIGNKAQRERLATRAKNPSDPLKLVIVRDMWLTGFDAPALHTLYVDKPMRGHGLMQAIARVNRVFRDKPAGLVVDFIGIAQRLKEALG